VTTPGPAQRLKVALLTREYPPEVYGGAGVHVTYLARELAGLVDLTVHCQGADRPDAVAHRPWDLLSGTNQALQTVSTDLAMTAGAEGAGLVHSHTWYANLGGHLASLLYGIPHVVTMHSLEPLRPWKAEQLGGGYAISSWCERVSATSAAAVIAVSNGMRDDILTAYPEIDPSKVRVIRNGIDTSEYVPDSGFEVVERYGIDLSRPYVIFVGRITRQKGVPVLLRAAAELDPSAQLVLCAGQADTPELLDEVTGLVNGLRDTRSGVVWIPEMLPKPDVIQLLSHAAVFAIPSLYEPLGIVNLEAMACGTAVVGSRVGGIPEVVEDGVTGLLVAPDDPAALARALNTVLTEPSLAKSMGQAGRDRAVAEFGWQAVAEQTAALYSELVSDAG
jgi:alpha-maltose-1-phosphate synthase